MKTSDIDSTMDDSKGYLQSMYEQFDDSQDGKSIAMQHTRINCNQQMKFILHWLVLIFVHWQIFFLIPIQGNMRLYNQPYCNPEDKKQFPYGCKNFHNNTYLIIFYVLFCIYFALSA